MKNRRLTGLVRALAPLFALILLIVIMSSATPEFATVNNWMNVLRQTAVNGFLATGMLLTLITAGIDLSVGTNAILSAAVMAYVMITFDVMNPLALLTMALLTGTFVGLVNGVLLTKLRLPHPFVSTLGMKYVLAGLALFLLATRTVGGFPEGVMFLGSADLFKGNGFNGFPVSFIAMLILFVAVHLLLNRTALGRSIYAVGGNLEATRLSGINTDRVLIFVYAAAGFCAAIAGIVIVGRSGVANPSAGMSGNYETDAIAACIIGGASFTGGKGNVWGTLIGALMISVIRNGLTLMNAQSDVQFMVIGAVIIAAVAIDVRRNASEEKRRRLAAA
ncbi:ABC transporter permease [Flaviflexus salsibiostraticola]|uniref:ABC transporter permease n=1 Tax=Flaviflexus salsibiostraticola TaxID=1282737 RepID=A0A3S8ZBS9_9ACTO|nr:ABC transporter permease [Flaviflexus salsibiostraticola]AZN30948.1 ABC transporter permease [Flaviflexus salsibiostraticola]